MTDRDRLIELMKQNPFCYSELSAGKLADHLLANGAVVLDMNVITPENRPLITHFAEMPLNDVLELIKAKKVVRCWECRHCDPEDRHCDHFMATTWPFSRKETDYCSYGELKEREGK